MGVVGIDKRVNDVSEAVNGIADGSTILIGGFGDPGVPIELIHGLLDTAAKELTIVCNNAGAGELGTALLLRERRIRKLVCSYPRSKGSIWFERRYAAGEIELELVPQGTLSERLRAAGAGIGGFFTPTGAGTKLAVGKETRVFHGRVHVFETALPGDFALIKAESADRWGNLLYRASARNYGPTMATAAATTIAQVRNVVGLGDIDPECVVTPGIFVDRVVQVPDPIAKVV